MRRRFFLLAVVSTTTMVLGACGGTAEEADKCKSPIIAPDEKLAQKQHKIYWGPLKKPLEWTLKTVLAPWSYIASVVYHDSFWYPLKGKEHMQGVLESEWGRLFRNWEHLMPDEQGFPAVGEDAPELTRVGARAFLTSLGVLKTAVAESPEFSARHRHP